MKTFVLILVIGIAVIGLTLGILLIFAQNRIKRLKNDKTNLREKNASLKEENAGLREKISKQSDQLRLKGIKEDRLTKEIKRLEKGKK